MKLAINKFEKRYNIKALVAILYFFIVHSACYCQISKDSVKVQGCLYTADNNEPITNAYVKISSSKRSYILAYLNTIEQNCFKVKLGFSDADSFFITISHTAYEDTTLKVSITDTTLQSLRINLSVKSKTLSPVIINTPPIWRRGDTTFFKADYFKEGNEQKLNELIVKLPGFEIDKNGNLLYQKRIIEKIMIEGQEIFADKIKLILSSIPVHVLNTVQALENQSENKMLRGLAADNKVFLNLGLKKEKINAAFGDGEIGAGTKNRYLLSATLFALQNKLKIGYIGNQNNSGNGFDWGEENELMPVISKNTPTWEMSHYTLQTVNNFKSTRYIENKKWDNRIQINLPKWKNTFNKTEIGFLKDNQQQQTSYLSSILNDSTYLQRSESTSTRYMPRYFLLQNTTTISLKNNAEIKTLIEFYNEGSRSSQNSDYKEPSFSYTALNHLQLKANQFAFRTDYTLRKSNNRAIIGFVESSYLTTTQLAFGISPTWYLIFQLPSTDYTNLSQHLSSKKRDLRSGIEWITKSKNGILTNGIELSISNINVESHPAFLTPNNQEFPLVDFQNKGKYTISALHYYIRTTYKFFKKPFNVSLTVGLKNVSIREAVKQKQFQVPVSKLSIGQKFLLQSYNLGYSFDFETNLTNSNHLNTLPFPVSTTSYTLTRNISKPVGSFNSTFFVARTFKNSTYLFFSSQYRHTFSATASYSLVSQFFTLGIDSIINNPEKLINNSLNIHFPSYALNTKFEIRFSHLYAQSTLLSRGNRIHFNKNAILFNITLKKNWGKKYFVTFDNGIDFSLGKSVLAISNNLSRLIAIKSSLHQRFAFGKFFSVAVNSELYSNPYKSKKNNTLFSDLECKYNIVKRNLSFRLLLSNLFNEAVYFSNLFTVTSQHFFSFPLTKRNVFFSIRYEL